MPAPDDPAALLAELPWLRRLATSLARGDGADLAQDVCAAALAGAPPEPASLRAWLAATARNLARAERRSAARRRAREHRGRSSEVRAESPADLTERAAAGRALLEAVMALDGPHRDVLLLRYFEDLPPRAVARRLDLPLRTVKGRLARALALLRERLDASGGGRARWLAALLPLAPRPARAALPPLLAAMKLKLLLACAASAAVALGVWSSGLLAPHGAETRAPGTLVAELATPEPRDGDRAAAALDVPSADESARAAAPAEPARATDELRPLAGRVVDSRGAPVAGAVVEARRNAARGLRLLDRAHAATFTVLARATADGDGRFALDAPPGRPLDLHAERAGFAPADAGPHWAGEEVRLVLTRGARLSGVVTRAADGAPCAGAVVRVRPAQRDDLLLDAETVTDASGAWSLDGLPAVPVVVTALPREALAVAGPEVFLTEGGWLTCDLAAEAGGAVAGRVTDAEGRAVAGAVVELEWWTPAKRVVADERGEYELQGVDTRAGRPIYLRASAPPGDAGDARDSGDASDARSAAVRDAATRGDALETGPARSAADAGGAGSAADAGSAGSAPGLAPRELRVRGDGGDPQRVDFVLLRGFAVRGRVVAEGAPLSGVYVAAVGSGRENALSGKDHVAAVTGADGRFELRSLRPDSAHVLLACRDGFGARVLDFPPGEGREPLLDLGDVTLAPGAVLSGVVVDEHGRPAVGARVECRGTSADRGALGGAPWSALDGRVGLREARADAAGRFAFADLDAGAYRVGASWRSDPPVELVEVPLERAARADVRLALARGLALEGRVQDAAGHPLAEALVSLWPAGDERRRAAAQWTAADGSFRIAGLAAGAYDVLVEPDPIRERSPLAARRLSAVSPGGGELVLVLEPARVLQGRVLRPDGSPAADVDVEARETARAGALWADARARTDADGRFRLPVAPDRAYALRAVLVERGPDGAERLRTAEAGESADGDTELRLAELVDGPP